MLRAADALNNCEIADTVGVTRQTVRTWRERFAEHRLDGLDDEPRCGAPRKLGDDRIEAIMVKTLETKPADATHWSVHRHDRLTHHRSATDGFRPISLQTATP